MIFRYQCSAQQGLNWRKEWMAFFGDYLFLIICNNSFKVSNSSFSAKLTYSSDVIFSNYNNRKHFSLAVYLQPHSIKLIKKLDSPACDLERHKITCKSLACAQALMTRVSRLKKGRLETSQGEVCRESGTNQCQTSCRPLFGSCRSGLHTFP